MTVRIADGTGVLLSMPGVGVLHIVGRAADMPGDNEVGYAHGCIFQVVDTSGSDTGIYTNVGTSAQCNFDAIEVAGGSTNATTVAGVTPGAGGLAVLDDASVSAIRTTLELGTFATQNVAATPALTMAGNIALGTNYLSGDGQNEGVYVGSTGIVGVGTSSLTGIFVTPSLCVGGTTYISNGGRLIMDGSADLLMQFATSGAFKAQWKYDIDWNTSGGMLFSVRGDSSNTPLSIDAVNAVSIATDGTKGAYGNTLGVGGDMASYNTFTNASNYERIRTYWNSNVATIATEAAGTGTARNIAITPAGGTVTVNGTLSMNGAFAFAEAKDITTGSTTGTKVGTNTTNKIGFWNTTPVVQPVHIADPAGGAVIDAEARTAIAAINAMLAATGLTAAA